MMKKLLSDNRVMKQASAVDIYVASVSAINLMISPPSIQQAWKQNNERSAWCHRCG